MPDTQRVLQSLTDRAVADLAANPRLARDLMSPGSYAQLRNGTGLADASYGKAVERFVARYVQEDELLSSILRHTGRSRGPNGRFISSPDFIGKEAYNLRLLDITTQDAIPRHLSRPGFGRSSEFVIHPGKGTTQFP